MVLFGVPPQNRKSNRPVDSNFVHTFQQQITKELTARDEGEDPFPKDPLLLPGMTSSKSSTMRVTPILKQEDGDMVRGDCANHKWTEAELTSRVAPLCVTPSQTLGYVPLGLGGHGEREFARKVRPGEVLRNRDDLAAKERRVLELRKQKQEIDRQVKELDAKVRRKQIENARASVGLSVVPQERKDNSAAPSPVKLSPTKTEFDVMLQRKISARRTHIMY